MDPEIQKIDKLVMTNQAEVASLKKEANDLENKMVPLKDEHQLKQAQY